MCDFICRNKHLFEQLDIFINSAKEKEDALMSTLHYAQSLFKYLPKDVLVYISKKLNTPYDEVHNLVNFYSFFSTELKGKFKINVCVGNACYRSQSSNILGEFEKLLGIKTGETTSDMKFSLESSGCVGACRKTPIVTVNGRVYDSVTLEDVVLILSKCN